MLKPAQGGQEGTAGVAEHDPQIRQPFQYPAENHRARRTGCFCRHAHQPRQPVLFHLLLAHHVPRMDHDRHSQALACFKEWKEAFLREVESVDVGANLHPQMTGVLGPFQLTDGRVGVLHGHRAKARVMPRIIGYQRTDVVVEKARDVLRMRQRCVVIEHHGDGAHHLDLGLKRCVFPFAHLRIPAVFADFTKELAALHHACKSRSLTWLQVDVLASPKPLGPLGHFAG